MLKMDWLATLVIIDLIGLGASPDLREPQAFKNVFLQMMIDQRFAFRHIFLKKLPTFKS